MKKYWIIIFTSFSTFISAQVGIGTTTPNANAALDINGASGGLLFPRVALTSTTNPTPLTLDVEGMTVYNTATVADVTPGVYYNNGALWIKLGATSSNNWGLIGNSGTVNGVNFIGTTDNQAVDFRVNNSIKARLATNGQLELINAQEAVFVGENSGSTSTGTRNVGLGFNTINTGNGNYNVAIGNRTMTKTDNSSHFNVAVGYLAMENSLNGGDWNNAFGYSALRNIVEGDGNTAIGHLSQASLTNGNKNTSLGYNSLYQLITGSENVAIGKDAAFSTETGSNNVTVGVGSSFRNKTGDYNVAIGDEALYRNVAGSYNIVLGNEAGYFETGSNKLYIDSSRTSSPLIGGDFFNDRAGVNYDINSLTHTLNVGGSVKIDTFLHLTPLTTAPGTPSEGDIYYNATLKKVQVYNGTAWENLN